MAARSQDPYWKSALLADSSKLQGLVPQIVEATKYSLQHPEDQKGPEKLHALIGDAKEIGRRIDVSRKGKK